ncbi:putative thiamine transport system permease protein [Cohaesibacter sp. ES.047]|uniref:ABC transporter permease n=1 Tax=Cohaesibacter sp. ES.047 TaxID=1798205 RepID=UPI000BB8CEF6|nr:ABC transporter permease subunit [Cohaesibacter sp. ES.047]SNY91798.1 putative thiamine transport system permease protein [Cohaesibacter sp. ES.047]
MKLRASNLATTAALALMIGPILAGLAGSLAPAFGWLPTLGGEALSLDPMRALVATPGISRSIGLSLASGVLTTLLALMATIGLLAAWSGTRFFGWMQRLISPLLSIPHAATAFGFAFLLAPSGWLVRLLSPELTGWARPPDWLFPHDPYGLAMIAGLAMKELPFLLLVSLAALPQTNPRRHANVARTLGYGRMAAWIYGVWPLLYARIRLPVFAVIAYASSVVDVALILGPTNPPTLAVQLVRWMSDPDLDMRFLASAGAILQLGVTLFALLIWWCGERLVARLFGCGHHSGLRFQRDGWLRLCIAMTNVIATLVMVLGLAGLAVWSFAGFWRFPDALPRSLGLVTWQRQASMLVEPLINSILIGGVATLIALFVTVACLETESRRGRQAGQSWLGLVYLPLIVPQVAFLFGLQLLFLFSSVNHSSGAIILGHLVFVMPYVLLSLGDPWRNLDPRYAQLAASLGRSRWTALWQIRLPLLIRPILTAAAVGFAVSIGQYLPTIIIGGGRWETITTEAVALSAGGNRRLIGVYALMQMLLPFLGFLVAMLVPALLYRQRRDMQTAGH